MRFGYRLLEPLAKHHSDISNVNQSESVQQVDTFTLKAKKYKAKAQQTDEGMVVLSGAEAAMTANPSLSKGYAKVRDELKNKGKLLPDGDKLILEEDTLFASPSQAAAVLLGYPCSGPEYWLDQYGVSLKLREMKM